MTKQLELGQRIHDASFLIQGKGSIVARRVGNDLQVLDGFETNEQVLRASKMFLENANERIVIADSGEVYFTWDEDEEVTEINDQD